MAEEKQRQQQWKLKARLRARCFDLKLDLRNKFPCHKLERFSLFLRFRKHYLKLESDSESALSGFKVSKAKWRSRIRRSLAFVDVLRIWNRREAGSRNRNEKRLGDVTLIRMCCVATLMMLIIWMDAAGIIRETKTTTAASNGKWFWIHSTGHVGFFHTILDSLRI